VAVYPSGCPQAHEGQLQQHVKQFVSNASLAHAALRLGFGPYIVRRPDGHAGVGGVGAAAAPAPEEEDGSASESDARGYEESGREVEPGAAADAALMKTKVLADVVEALIGAFFVAGGALRVWCCTNVSAEAGKGAFEWTNHRHLFLGRLFAFLLLSWRLSCGPSSPLFCMLKNARGSVGASAIWNGESTNGSVYL
jgi:Ribonuclease III domain